MSLQQALCRFVPWTLKMFFIQVMAFLIQLSLIPCTPTAVFQARNSIYPRQHTSFMKFHAQLSFILPPPSSFILALDTCSQDLFPTAFEECFCPALAFPASCTEERFVNTSVKCTKQTLAIGIGRNNKVPLHLYLSGAWQM